MTEAGIYDTIKNMISNEVLVGVSVEEIGDDASLISDLNLDSIQMMSLITGLENAFDIMLDDEDLDLENLSSVKRLAEFVKKKLGSS
jgi:acyl carrier protein